MAFQKDTIRLIVQFRDFDGKNIIPTDVTLTIYKEDKTEVETITTNITQKSDSFSHDYLIPEHDFIYEFSGVYQEKPILARQLVKTKFI